MGYISGFKFDLKNITHEVSNAFAPIVKKGEDIIQSGQKAATQAISQAEQKIEDALDIKKYINQIKQEYYYIKNQYLPALIKRIKDELVYDLKNKVFTNEQVDKLKKEYAYIRDQYIPQLLLKYKDELVNLIQHKLLPKLIETAKTEGPKLISMAKEKAVDYIDTNIKPKAQEAIEDATKATKIAIIIVGSFCALTLLIQLGILISILRKNRSKTRRRR